MATVSTQYQFLERNPKSNYKQLFIKGRRIRARVLYGAYMSEEEPQTIEEIADNYDVPIEAVKEAIAYCDSDPVEIREDFAREEAIMEATGMNDPDYKYHPSPRLLSPQEHARIYCEIEERFCQGTECRWRMRLYLDEDSVHGLLVKLLQRAGHDIEIPSDVGLVGRSDPIHLRYSIGANRPLVSANHDDFRDLHNLILQAGGVHSGILIVRHDNDRRRDLTPRGIVTAVGHLLTANMPVENQFIVLNHWR